jgi:predicted RNA-binding Zn-ribbon protein involved in translation (DUF1610 family)
MEERPTAKAVVGRVDAQAVEPAAFAVSRRGQRDARRTEDIHICPSCGSELVQPVDWAPAPARCWVVELRCPDCEWTGGGTYSQSVVDRFDETLDDGTQAVLEDLELLTRANMEAEIEAFAGALRSDQILPEDF